MSRLARLPTNVQVPRPDLDVSACQSIDVALKSLRKGSRQVQQIATSLANDLHMLERIYYKSKNTQRPTMAWKKVVELRRAGDRMKGAGLQPIVDALRRSFYDTGIFQEGEE